MHFKCLDHLAFMTIAHLLQEDIEYQDYSILMLIHAAPPPPLKDILILLAI